MLYLQTFWHHNMMGKYCMTMEIGEGEKAPLGRPYLPRCGNITVDREPACSVALHPSCVAFGTCQGSCYGEGH